MDNHSCSDSRTLDIHDLPNPRHAHNPCQAVTTCHTHARASKQANKRVRTQEINRTQADAHTHAHTYTRTRTHACTHARTRVRARTHTHTRRTHAQTCVFLHTRTHARTHARTHTPYGAAVSAIHLLIYALHSLPVHHSVITI